MAITRAQCEALQCARITRPTKIIATVLEALFLTKLTSQQCGPLINAATELFSEHWTGSPGVQILVPAYNSLELVTLACTQWQADLYWAYSSATHAAKIHAHIAALGERIANPNKEQGSSGPLVIPQMVQRKPLTRTPSIMHRNHTCPFQLLHPIEISIR